MYIIKGEIDGIVAEVIGSHEKVQELAEDALLTFQSIKNQTIQIGLEAEEKIIGLLYSNTELKLKKLDKDNEETRLRQMLQKSRDKLTDSRLLDPELWNHAGYSSPHQKLPKETAKALIENIFIEAFRFRDDAKKDLLLVKGEKRDKARSRKHVGVRDWNNVGDMLDVSLLQNNPAVDSTIVFYYNFMALKKLADDIEYIELKIAALARLLSGDKSPSLSLEKIQVKIKSTTKFETVTDLSFRIATLNTEVSENRILKILEAAKHTFKIGLLRYKAQKLNGINTQSPCLSDASLSRDSNLKVGG